MKVATHIFTAMKNDMHAYLEEIHWNAEWVKSCCHAEDKDRVSCGSQAAGYGAEVHNDSVCAVCHQHASLAAEAR